ncbi:MAG: hypothetical protein ACE5JZ_08365, partial [Kiloniellales bacterium]
MTALARAFGEWLSGGYRGRLVRLVGAERERWALWLPVGVGAGVVVYFSLAWEPPWWLGLAVLAAVLAVAGLLAAARPAWR